MKKASLVAVALVALMGVVWPGQVNGAEKAPPKKGGNRMMRRVILALVLVGGLFVQGVAVASVLPTHGTFEGVYHQDLWGVGYFGSFIVHPDLHEKLAKYEGKLIRLEVTKGSQPMVPGAAIMLAIGKVEVLPSPPLEIRVRTRPAKVVAGRPYQIIVEIVSKTKDGVLLEPIDVGVSVRCPSGPNGPRADEPSRLIKEYTVRQMSSRGGGGRIGFRTMFGGRPNLSVQGGKLQLKSGASYVWAMPFAKGPPPGDCEVGVGVFYALTDLRGARKSMQRFSTWHRLSSRQKAPDGAKAAQAEKLLAVSELKMTTHDGGPADLHGGWTDLSFRLSPAKGKTVRVPGMVDRVSGKVDAKRLVRFAMILAVAGDGSGVWLMAERFPKQDARHTVARLVKLPEAGTVISGRFRKHDWFAPPITQLRFRVLTDHGIETIVLTRDVKDPDTASTTPFGPESKGIKIRIRPARAAFKYGRRALFYVQAVNSSGKPACWWGPSNGAGENVIIEIDGKKIKQPDRKVSYIHGWASKGTCGDPDRWGVVLPAKLGLAKGKHTLRYTVVSRGGTYTNSLKKSIPLFRGKIVSNTTTFVVE